MKETRNDRNKIHFDTQVAARALGLACLGVSLVGCAGGISDDTSAKSVVPSARAITGNVHGGQNPVIGAAIQLYAVGSGSPFAAATPLISVADQVVYNSGAPAGTTGALTNSAGDFYISGDYTCPTPSPQVYLVATGGNSGSGSNAAIALMAPMGDCATLVANAASTIVQINEVTTIASVYALAPFMSGYKNVGATAVNAPGLIQAAANFKSLANITTGLAGGSSLPAGASVPTTEINTLADIIAACVNTANSTSSLCSTLLTATSSTDTIGAALAIAKNPGRSAYTALTSMIPGTGVPFQPYLSSTPSDWSIAIKYTAGGTLSAPYGVAIDSGGNAWVSNAGGSSVTQLTASGAVANIYSGAGLLGPKGVAIDYSGNVWVANPTTNSVVKIALSSPTVISGGTAYSAGGLNGPVAVAADQSNNIWIANLNGNSVTELNTAGAAVRTSLTAGGTISQPTGIALDSTGNVYVANAGGGNVVKLVYTSGAAASGSPLNDYALQGVSGVALDPSGNVYALGSTTGTSLVPAVSTFSSAGAAASYSPSAAPATTGLYAGIVAAGTGSVLMTNSTAAGSLVAETLGTSPVSVTLGSLNTPVGLAVDPSGDVWVANSGDNTVAEFIGLTAPVTTPIVANVGP